MKAGDVSASSPDSAKRGSRYVVPILRSAGAVSFAKLAPVLLLLIVFFAAPLFEAAWRSVDGASFNLSRYREIFDNPLYFDVLIRTFEVSAVTTFFCVVLGYPMAFLLTTFSQRGRALMAIAIVVPLFTAFLIRTYGWMIILGRAGVLNKMLLGMGVIDTPMRILGTHTAVYIGLIHVLMPLAIFTMYASMSQVDRSLMTAAQVMGANPVRAFTRVYLPMTLPGVISAAMLVFIMSMGFFVTPVLLGGPADTMIAQLIVTQITTLLDFEFGYALSIVLIAATLAAIVFSNFFVPIEQMWALQDSHGGRKARISGSAHFRPLLFALAQFERVIYLVVGRPRWLIPFLLRMIASGIVVFLIAPIVIVYYISFSSSPFLIFPPPGYSLQLYKTFLSEPPWREALFMSLRLAAIVATLSVVVGALASFALVRSSFPAKRVVFLFVLSPLLVPVVVTSLVLYVSTAHVGLLGTYTGLVIGHMILAVPYTVIVLVAAVRGLDRNVEYAAATLGAPPVLTFRKVVLPALGPGLSVAWLLAFLHSFDELLVTLFLLGRLPQTLPLKIWGDIRIQIDPVIAAASSTIITVVILAVVLSRWRDLFPQDLQGGRREAGIPT